MRRYLFVIFAGFAATAVPSCAETYQQQARIVGGGGNQGKCTVEVVVDGSAEVEIRGGNAFLRPLSRQQPQLRRFECTGVMPINPMDFRFRGVDGRGTQRLIRDPQNGGVAMVRIDNARGGADTFEVAWSEGGPFSANAIRTCENAVRQQAFSCFNTRDISVRVVASVDNSGPRDTIYGTVNVHSTYSPDQTYPFSCAVNYSNGRVLATRIDSRPIGGYAPAATGPAGRTAK